MIDYKKEWPTTAQVVDEHIQNVFTHSAVVIEFDEEIPKKSIIAHFGRLLVSVDIEHKLREVALKRLKELGFEEEFECIFSDNAIGSDGILYTFYSVWEIGIRRYTLCIKSTIEGIGEFKKSPIVNG